MPRKRFKKRKVSKKPGFGRKYLYLSITIIFLIIASYFVLRTNKWNGKDKLSLVVRNGDSSLSLFVFDPVLEEIYNLQIPGNTEVEVSGEYGIWKVKSLWDLGKQEGLDGVLVARSITMGLRLPVYAWADEQALGLADTNIKTSLPALFSSYKSNLIFGDKLRLILFSTKINNKKRFNIDLAATSFLEKSILSDGEEGYRITKIPPQNISVIFSEPVFSNEIVRVSIKDSTSKVGLANKVSSVIEVLGGKISSIDTIADYDGVCTIKTKNKNVSDILLKVFECEENIFDPDLTFDLEIILGKEFATKY